MAVRSAEFGVRSSTSGLPGLLIREDPRYPRFIDRIATLAV
jgi:hypothetical protein